MQRRCVRQALQWSALCAAVVALSLVFEQLGVPAAELFAGLISATLLALARFAPDAFPWIVPRSSQAILGVLIGTKLNITILDSAKHSAVPIVLIVASTLVFTLGAGLLLGMRKDVSPVTGILSLAPGGASSVTAISHELGGDSRSVAVLQFLRLGIVTMAMPVVVLWLSDGPLVADRAPETNQPWFIDLAFVGVCAVLGAPLGRLLRLPAGALLGPMLVSAAAAVIPVPWVAPPPTVLTGIAFAVIGSQAGLRFTPKSLKELARMLPLALTLIIVIIVVCAGLGLVLAKVMGISPLEGYLATTPGGIYAVLAFAVASHVDVTFVTTVQVLRVFAMLLVLPAIASAVSKFRERRSR